ECGTTLDRSTDRSAVLVEAQFVGFLWIGIEVVARVECVVAQKLVDLSVKIVGAGGADHADDTTRRKAILGGDGAAFDLELLNRVCGRVEADFAGISLQNALPVDQNCVRRVGSAIDADGGDERSAVDESFIDLACIAADSCCKLR